MRGRPGGWGNALDGNRGRSTLSAHRKRPVETRQGVIGGAAASIAAGRIVCAVLYHTQHTQHILTTHAGARTRASSNSHKPPVTHCIPFHLCVETAAGEEGDHGAPGCPPPRPPPSRRKRQRPPDWPPRPSLPGEKRARQCLSIGPTGVISSCLGAGGPGSECERAMDGDADLYREAKT